MLDLSFRHPEAQTTLFSINQWKELKCIFRHTNYDVEEYDSVKKNVSQVAESYKSQKPWSSNWKVMHKKLKFLKPSFDLEENEKYDGKHFCLRFMELVLDLIKYHRYLFEEGIDVSEWYFIRKFWAPVLENLPALSGSRLEWYVALAEYMI